MTGARDEAGARRRCAVMTESCCGSGCVAVVERVFAGTFHHWTGICCRAGIRTPERRDRVAPNITFSSPS